MGINLWVEVAFQVVEPIFFMDKQTDLVQLVTAVMVDPALI